MSKLFEPIEINGLILENRFVRSATWEGMAEDDGRCSSRLQDLLEKLAQGGVGLIITSHAYVQHRGKARPRQLGIHSDEMIPKLSMLTEAVHRGGSNIVMQLSHAGLFSDPQLTGRKALAPSALSGFTETAATEMNLHDIRDVVKAFGVAAGRAQKAQFDGVQIHAAHGYLLSQFLSPAFNKRSDSFGGDIEKRATILLEVIAEIRACSGPDYPIMVKLNSNDFLAGGLGIEESLEAAVLLQNHGVDAIELSGGTIVSGELIPSRKAILREGNEAYFRDAASYFKNYVNIPIFLVGGVRSFHVAEQIVADNIADGISMSRPLIREPDLINRWKFGDRRKATCISDNQCFGPAISGEGIYCVIERNAQNGNPVQ